MSNTTLVGYDIPLGVDNPYDYVAHRLQMEMYPPFTRGFPARVACLVGLLCLLILVSLAYITIQMREARQVGGSLQDPVWIARVIRRPEGHYFVVNQHFLYPLCSIFMAAVWIAYVFEVYTMFGHQGQPQNLYFWLANMWIPFYIHLATTTFAVVGGANLASKSVSNSSHWLGPWLHNGLYLFLIPVVVSGMVATGIWTSIAWHRFGERWLVAHDALVTAAIAFTGTRDATRDENLFLLTHARVTAFYHFYDRQHACVIVYATSAAFLIVVNLFGGLTLLSKIRSVGSHRVSPRDEPLVAPLDYGSELPPITLSGEIPVAGGVTVDIITSRGTKKLQGLRWDITLFFFAVIPACSAFIAYSIWAYLRFPSLLVNGELLEFCCLGMIWIYTALAAGSMSAIAIKKLLTNNSLPRSAFENSLVKENKQRLYRRAADDSV